MATPGRKASWTRPASLYEALDNGFRWCADPATLQRICNRLGARDVHTFFWRWFHRLPSPFTADALQAGYAYELAFRQFEVSDTRVFDRPQAGRAFFEGVIRDHLDLVRPAQVVVIFDRKLMPRTPGRSARKRSSAIPATLGLAVASAHPTGQPCGPAVRRPTIFADSAARASSLGCPTHITTNSPHSAGAPPSCSPRHTAECWRPVSLCSILSCPPISPNAARSPAPGDNWTSLSLISSTTNSARPKLDHSVNLRLGKPR